MIFKNGFIKRKIVQFRMYRVQRLDGYLHQLAPCLHHFVNFISSLINDGAPLPRNPKALDTLNFIFAIEATLSNQHILSYIRTYRMFRVDNSPRVALEDKHRSGTIPKIVEKVFKWNIVPNLRKFVDLLKGVIDLLLILFNIDVLRFFKGVEIMRKL